MKALIAAGGRGTRLRPITNTINKHLIPLANKQMIFYALEKIAEAGITEVAININEGDKELPAAIGDGSQWGLNVTFIEQKGGALGVAHVIKNAKEWLGDDSFVFYLGDNIILGSIVEFVEAFKESDADAFLALSKVPDPERFGVPEIDENGNITKVLEKPEVPPSEYAVTGIYCYKSNVHDAVEGIAASDRGELEISDVHSHMIENGKKVSYQVVEGWWKDTGKPLDLLEGNALLMDLIEGDVHGEVADSVTQEGMVSIGEGSVISGDTKLIGPVIIGKNVTITNAVIGPHAAIGDNSSIQDAKIEQSIVMDNATIHHDIHIKQSLIGHNASIVNHNNQEDGHRMILGENSLIEL